MLDASVTLAWLFPDESSPLADAVFRGLDESDRAVVPAIWPLEIANTFWSAERRGRLTAAEIDRKVRALREMRIEVSHQLSVWAYSHALPFAREFGLSVYDASYLRLAKDEGLPIATVDAALIEAAGLAGVVVFRPAGR